MSHECITWCLSRNRIKKISIIVKPGLNFTKDEFVSYLEKEGVDLFIEDENGKITKEIIERIEKAFVLNPFETSRQEKNHLQLNFGAATFWKDGETANQLLQHAHLRKQQTKSGHNNKVLWFPKEYVN